MGSISSSIYVTLLAGYSAGFYLTGGSEAALPPTFPALFLSFSACSVFAHLCLALPVVSEDHAVLSTQTFSHTL